MARSSILLAFSASALTVALKLGAENEERFIDHGAAIVDKTGLNLAAEQVWRGLLGDCNVQPLMCVTLRWVIESNPICCGWVFWAFIDDALVRKIDSARHGAEHFPAGRPARKRTTGSDGLEVES